MPLLICSRSSVHTNYKNRWSHCYKVLWRNFSFRCLSKCYMNIAHNCWRWIFPPLSSDNSLVGLSQSPKSKFLFPGSQAALTNPMAPHQHFVSCWSWKAVVMLLSPGLAMELTCCSVLAFVVKPSNAGMQQTSVCVAVNEPLGRFASFVLFPCLSHKCKT